MRAPAWWKRRMKKLLTLRRMTPKDKRYLFLLMTLLLLLSCKGNDESVQKQPRQDSIQFESFAAEADFMDGTANFYYPDGKTLKRTAVYHDGILSGPEVCYYPDGLTKGVFYHDQAAALLALEFFYPDGRMLMKVVNSSGMTRITDYYENGQISETFLVDKGRPEGEYLMYYPNGNLRKRGYYRSGEVTGLWEFFSEDGDSVKEISY